MAGSENKEKEREARWRMAVDEFVKTLLYGRLPLSLYLARIVARAKRYKVEHLRAQFRYDLLSDLVRVVMERNGIDEVLASRNAYAKLAKASTKLPEGDKGWERFQKVIEELGAHEAFRLFEVKATNKVVVVQSMTFTLREEAYSELDEEGKKKVRDAIGNKRALTIEEPPEGFLKGKSLAERRRSS